MKKMLRFVSFLIGITASTASYAQAEVDTDHFSRTWQECVLYGERHNTLAIPEGECNERELRLQDARLNQAYRMVMSKLPMQRKADLRTDERNWIAARDRKCLSRESDSRGECLINETMKRVAYLERTR